MRKRDIKKNFYLSYDENRKLQKNAKKTGLTESTYLRLLIEGYKPSELPDESMHDMLNQLRGISTNLNQIARQANAIGYFDAKRYDDIAQRLDEFMQEFKYRYFEMHK